MRPIALPAVAALLLTAGACVPVPPPNNAAEQSLAATELTMYEWFDDGGPGTVDIRINLTNQKAYIRRGERFIGWSYVATGKPGKGTPAGRFNITEKVVDKYSNKYGWIENEFGEVVNDDATPGTRVPPGCRYVAAPMPFWMRLTDYGIGMHAGYIPNPGMPASHGCIRFPKRMAPLLYDVVGIGTSVYIHHGDAFEPNPQPPGATLASND